MNILKQLRASLSIAALGGKAIQRQGLARDKNVCRSKLKPHQGSNETIRRKRQIERGMLQVS
jgi:hypothetical protein